MSDDIVQGTGLTVTKDEYKPCKEHGGAHLVRTFVATKGDSYVHVAQERGQKMEVVVSHKGKTTFPPERLSETDAKRYIRDRLSE